MFRFHKTKDIITLFHKASVPSSVRVATLLKQVSANASETATEDQASDHSAQSGTARAEFDYNITEDAPTPDQLKNILDYVGGSAISSVVKGATSTTDALKKFKQDQESFQRPVIVDWNNGRAVAGSNESQILKMLKEAPKE